jgi:hypothetical protein
MGNSRIARTSLSLATILCAFASSQAQDLEPRAFSPAPVGMNVVLAGYSFSEGNVFFDRALLIEDATGEVHGASGAYVRTFGIAGMSAKALAAMPFVWGDWRGLVDGQPASTSRRGLADSRVQLAVNFFGAPAASLKEFAAHKEGTIVGASLLAVVPLGEYDSSKLINLGSGRWAFRPRLGFSNRIRRFTIEAMVDAWIFTEIPEAYGKTTISQDPIWALQAGVIYSFRNGIWLGISGGMSEGGKTTVNGVQKDNAQENSRFGATLNIPLNRRYSFRVFYTNSVRTRLGADFDFFNASLQYRWGGGL